MARTDSEQRVLVVDDDEGVRTVVSWQLEAAGYSVVQAEDGVRAQDALGGARPDLVVLDLSLPGISGLELLRRVRDGSTAASPDLPIIVLSGRSSQADRISGLDQGADDYLVKPFSPGELEARIRSLLRRAGSTGSESSDDAVSETITLGTLRVDPSTRNVDIAGRRIELTAKEFDLLWFFVTHPRQVFSRTDLLIQVWQSTSGWQGEATVTEHIHRLRGKVETNPAKPTLLRTVRGVGYQLEPGS